MVDVTKKALTEPGGDGPVVRRRGGIVQFFQEVAREMSKVTWPSWKETWLTSVMVFIMVLLTMLFFFFVDAILAYGQRLLTGAV